MRIPELLANERDLLLGVVDSSRRDEDGVDNDNLCRRKLGVEKMVQMARLRAKDSYLRRLTTRRRTSSDFSFI